jgi:hypothetical protein
MAEWPNGRLAELPYPTQQPLLLSTSSAHLPEITQAVGSQSFYFVRRLTGNCDYILRFGYGAML